MPFVALINIFLMTAKESSWEYGLQHQWAFNLDDTQWELISKYVTRCYGVWMSICVQELVVPSWWWRQPVLFLWPPYLANSKQCSNQWKIISGNRWASLLYFTLSPALLLSSRASLLHTSISLSLGRFRTINDIHPHRRTDLACKVAEYCTFMKPVKCFLSKRWCSYLLKVYVYGFIAV